MINENEPMPTPIIGETIECGNCGHQLKIHADNVADIYFHLSWKCEKKTDESA